MVMSFVVVIVSRMIVLFRTVSLMVMIMLRMIVVVWMFRVIVIRMVVLRLVALSARHKAYIEQACQ